MPRMTTSKEEVAAKAQERTIPAVIETEIFWKTQIFKLNVGTRHKGELIPPTFLSKL